MYYDLKSATYRDGYKIELTFEDGTRGVVDFSRYLEKGGVFEKFQDIDFFKKFRIHEELKVLCWEDDVDIAPEAVYSEVAKKIA